MTDDRRLTIGFPRMYNEPGEHRQMKSLGLVGKTLPLHIYGHLTPAMTQRVADRMDLVIRRPASGG